MVPILEYDCDAGRYGGSWSEEVEAMGIEIAPTFQFIDVAERP